MENELITEEECEETLVELESDQIQDIDSASHLNVIPLHLIKLARDVKSQVVKVEPKISRHNINIDVSPGESNFETAVKGKYSKYYKQTYRPAWEHMPDFKGWLRGVKGQPTRAYCTYCQKTLHAHRLSLLKHTCTIRHQKAAQLHGSPTVQKNNFPVGVNSKDIQTVIVNEDGVLTEEEDTDDMMQSHSVYTTKEEMEEAEEDTNNDPDHEDDSEDDDELSANKQENAKVTKRENVTNAPPISTHVIDTTRGAPVFGLSVSLYKLVEGRWTYINEGSTDSKGRCSSFFNNSIFSTGRYKLHYDVDRYFEHSKQDSLFPFIEVVFDTTSVSSRYHFPLLLGPYSYTAYRTTHDE